MRVATALGRVVAWRLFLGLLLAAAWIPMARAQCTSTTKPGVYSAPFLVAQGIPRDAGSLLEGFVVARARSANSNIDIVRQNELEAIAELARRQQLVGTDADRAVMMEELIGASGAANWMLTGAIAPLGERWQITLRLVDTRRGAAVLRSHAFSVPNTDPAGPALETGVGVFVQGLGCEVLRNRLTPIVPRLVVTLQPGRGNPGERMQIRARLTDLAAGNAPEPERQVVLTIITPQGPREERNLRTDGAGYVTTHVELGAVHPRAGAVKARFVRSDGYVREAVPVNYYIVPASGALSLSSTKTQLRPLGADTVQAELKKDNQPVAARAVNVTATTGAVGTASVITDRAGTATVGYVAPSTPVLVDVSAAATVPDGNGGSTPVQGALSYVVDPAVVVALQSGGDTAIFGASAMKVDVERDRQPVAGATVSYAVAGGGTVSAVTAATDANGRSEVMFVAPSRPGTSTVTASVTVDGQTYTRSVTVAYSDPADAITREIIATKEALYLAPTDANLARLDRLRALLLGRGETARAEALLADNQMVGGQLTCTHDRAHRDCAAGLRDRGEGTLRLLKSITAGSSGSIASTVFNRASDSLVRCPHPLFMDRAVYFDRADMRDIGRSYTWGMFLAMQWDNDRRFKGLSFSASDETNPDRLFARGFIPTAANATSPYSGTIAPATGDVGSWLSGNYFQINEYQRNATRPTASISVNGTTVSGFVDLYDGTDQNGVRQVATLGFATTVTLPAAPEATSCHHSALPRVGPESALPRPVTRR